MLDRLTATRFVAAMMVVCFHLGRNVPLVDHRPWSGVLMAGPLAVSYFFVLSGFIMACVHGELRLSGAGGFWRARLARIYPVYLLGLILSIGSGTDVTGWLLSLSLLQSWVPGYALSGNLVGWSLSVEMVFYGLFPFLIMLARRLGLVRWCGLAGGLWLASQAWAVLGAARWPGPVSSTWAQWVAYAPPTHIATFLVGMTAGLLVRKGRLVLSAGQARCALAGSLCLAAAIALVPLHGPARHVQVLVPLFAASIVALCFVPSRWRVSAWAMLLGEASYALYILHWPVSRLLVFFVMPSLGLSPLAGFCLMVTVLIAASVGVFVRIERPARALLRYRTFERRGVPSAYALT